jgi:ferrous iron transport protein B
MFLFIIEYKVIGLRGLKTGFRKPGSVFRSTFADLQAGPLHIALVGNPNSGKSSLFNCLTGMNQQVGNFPGVTVDKTIGRFKAGELNIDAIDLPGTYSLYPKRMDEWVSYRVVIGDDESFRPNLVVAVVDASNLKRNLLLATQLIDLSVPVVIALTMMDLARKKGIQIDIPALERELGVPVVAVNPRKNKGIIELKKMIQSWHKQPIKTVSRSFIDSETLAPAAIRETQALFPEAGDYKAIHYLINHESLSIPHQKNIESIEIAHQFNPTKTQAEEILLRYARIREVMQTSVSEPDPLKKKMVTERLDSLFLHRRWGNFILLAVLFLLFQSVYWLAKYPMDWIEGWFGAASGWLGTQLPVNAWSDLLINGVMAGLGGILVFVPQIMILFGIITLLEDTGYMARISFLTDRLMRSVGLNGKSVMPMISGFACAVPAIMSARNIENRKERLLTILVTPLMSCSARLPVYAILTGLVIPEKYLFGLLSLQGLVMMGLYVFGVVIALLVSNIAKFFIRIQEKSFFILELPDYRMPRWGNIVNVMISKARIFLFDAGKVIMIISLVLWALSSFGPAERMQAVEQRYATIKASTPKITEQDEREYHSAKLEASYAGLLGKSIEPAIVPLGFDWKIGIALVTSFAAREVFVGTMATLYSVGEDEPNSRVLKDKMRNATRPDGSIVFSLATGVSLLIFYALAMQCMSTLAVVRRETKSWKWPAIQLFYMTGLAWIFSWIAYQLLR